MMDPFIATGVVLGLSVAYIYWTRLKRKWEAQKPFEGLPMPPCKHWLKGHIGLHVAKRDFRLSLKILMEDAANEHGQTGYWIFNIPALSVTSWQDARAVLRQDYFRRRNPFFEHHINMFLGSRNIGVLTGRQWKMHRSAILRSFATAECSRKTIVDASQTMICSLQKRMNEFPNGLVLDIEQLMKMITVDVFSRVAFSTDLKCCENLLLSPIAKALEYLSAEVTRRVENPLHPLNLFYWFPTPANRRHNRERSLLRAFFAEQIRERKSVDGTKPVDFLSELIATSDGDEDSELDDTLEDVLMSLLFAGYDTTTITLTYALHLISQHPEVEENIVNEVAIAATMDEPANFTYCEGVLYETLRLYPPAYITKRTLRKPLQLEGGFVAPTGSNVIVPIWLIQRSEKFFPDGESFRPDRWVKRGSKSWESREDTDDSGSIAAANRNAFFAFSAGARSCVGQKFAMQEATLVLANLLKSLRFRSVPGYELEPKRDILFLQRPKGGLPMNIESR